MLEFSARTSIPAPAAIVWQTLLDTDRWTAWDQKLEGVDGDLAPHGRITIHVRDSRRPFKLRVVAWQPEQLIELRGGMPLGLFVGTRIYRLTEQADSTTFEMTERYTGLLAPLITRSIRDEDADPPALVVQVGSTRLSYQLRCIDDLHAMLVERADWMPLGNADEGKEAKPDTVEAWARSGENPVGGWYGLRKGYRGRFGNYVPPVLEALGLAEVEHNPRNNRIRALD